MGEAQMTAAATAEPIIQFENVHKYYGSHHVLKGITEAVAQGEVVVVIGPSGSGESTLLRCINRLEEIDSGRILVAGQARCETKAELLRLRSRSGLGVQQ